MVDLKKIETIKELYKEGSYSEIALFIEPNFRIYSIVNEYRNYLTEAERIVAAISYYIYRLDNPLVEVGWNFEKNIINLRCEMFHLGGLDEGIKELLENDNEYFKENANLFIDVDFLNNCNARAISYLYNTNYKDMIVKGVLNYKINASYLINELLSIKEFKESVITKEFLLHGFNSRCKNYFLDLPDDRKELLGLYGTFVFGDNSYNEDTCKKYRNILKELYNNNFPEFNDDLIDRIIQLYGKVSYQAICYLLKKIEEDNDYLNKIQDVSSKYFSKRLDIVLSFAYKYPILSSKILKCEDLNNDAVDKIINLSNIGILGGIDSLSISDFLNCNIKDYSLSFDGSTKLRNHSVIGPFSFKDSVVLYNYCYGIATINGRGEWKEYLVSSSHYDTLNEIYSYNKKNGLELMYEINASGDIVFAMENAGLIIWIPSIITKEQRSRVIEKLDSLKNISEVEAYIMIANLDKEYEYISLNNDIPINVEDAIDSIKRIKVDDSKKLIKKIV